MNTLIEFAPNKKIIPCKCGNNTKFNLFSEQVCEDACEIWAECAKCGYDPTSGQWGARYEDIWGSITEYNARIVMMCWNDAMNPELLEEANK
jgi:hypothetical protein